MISTKTRQLVGRIGVLRAVQLSDQHAAAAEARRQRLVRLRDDLASTRAFLEAADAQGIGLTPEDAVAMTLEAAAEVIRTFGVAVSENHAILIEGDEFERTMRACGRGADALRAHATRIWREHAQAEGWNDRLEVTRALARAALAGTPRRQQFGQLENTLTELVRIASKPVPVPEELRRWDELREEHERRWRAVEGGEQAGDPAVLAFIKAAGGVEGAPLLEYTEEVKLAFQALGLTYNFRVVLRRTHRP